MKIFGLLSKIEYIYGYWYNFFTSKINTIMAKRFSDTDKWKDNWFFNLSNDHKLIWIYLLDNCDHAGIFKLNIKQVNFNCSTNISVEEFFILFKDRITRLNADTIFINKFPEFQYGRNFLTSKQKAVQSAIDRLIQVGLVEQKFGIYTLTQPLPNP